MNIVKGENIIPLDQAIEEATNWRTLASEHLGEENFIKAFTIPAVDFSQILDEGAVNIRVYLANSSENHKKLLLVGIDAEGNDMIDYANGKFIYDFTTPCPSACCEESPLN